MIVESKSVNPNGKNSENDLWISPEHALRIRVRPSSESRFLLQGKEEYFVTQGTLVGSIGMFRPDILEDPWSSHRAITKRLFLGIDGARKFFEEVDNGSLPEPQYLVGYTNRTMAVIAAKVFGFDFEKTWPYEAYGEQHWRYRIAVKTSVARSKLTELLTKKYSNDKTVVDMLRERIENG